MVKPDTVVSNHFDRPKLLLFKFLAHQIHPFAYAVNTFLRPALDDCLELMHTNPQDTFNVLLSLTQTFSRFAPESELIYDDIQQFAIKLKDAIDQCFTWLDPNTIRQSSQLLESTHQSLQAIIQQQNTENTTYTNMYKNMSAVLTNLEKINSLPMEMQAMSFEKLVPSQKANKQEIPRNNQEHKGDYNTALLNRKTTMTPPPGMSPIPIEKPLGIYPPSAKTQLSNNVVSSMDSMRIPSVSLTSNSSTIASRPVSTVSYLNEYEIVDTSSQTAKKSRTNVASFPPRQNASLFTSVTPTPEKPSFQVKTDTINGHRSSFLNEVIKSEQSRTQLVSNKNENVNNQERDILTPTPSNGSSIRFGSTSGPQTMSMTASVHSKNKEDWDNRDETSSQYRPQSRFAVPITTNTEWHSGKDHRSTLNEQFLSDQTKTLIHPHITDDYVQEFGNKQNRPSLRGELYMTYGTPQSGPQSSCLPIGVGLSYDESTLLSCDVHRNGQNVRLFDIQTGRLKHTISSNQQMKFHRPGAVMSNARNSILIVERDSIYITEPDGRLIQTVSHRSIKQLYGIASFRDRYILTIDSKSPDNQSAENCRILLFDPNSGQLVFEQNIAMNRLEENLLKQQYDSHIQGRVLSEATSKPRFIAAHNDDIYIADLGRSLIYGTSLRNQFDLTCTTVFGGHGRANGEMHDPAGLFIDSGGNIINADSKNDRIQLFASNGEYKTTFKLNEYIKRPSGICSNRAGTQFYVSCYLAGCVRAFDVSY